MSPRDIVLSKVALRCLSEAGPSGLGTEALMDHVAAGAEVLLTSLERRALMGLLVERDWIYSFRDPLTGNVRWVLTSQGELAKNAL